MKEQEIQTNPAESGQAISDQRSGHELDSRSGQAIVEYIILLSIVFGIVGFFISKMTGSLDSTTARYGGKVEQQLRTGQLPPSVWTK